MRTVLHPKLSVGRIRHGKFASDDSFGPTGCFEITGPMGPILRIIASDAEYDVSKGWEHVSVSLPNRCPNWPEMCFVKDLFWTEDETVIQFHPPKADYVNNHAFCLHMWRDTKFNIRLPPSILVGIKDLGTIESAR